jgi:hypothetical protein
MSGDPTESSHAGATPTICAGWPSMRSATDSTFDLTERALPEPMTDHATRAFGCLRPRYTAAGVIVTPSVEK